MALCSLLKPCADEHRGEVSAGTAREPATSAAVLSNSGYVNGQEREERQGREITSMEAFRVHELWELRTVFSSGAGAGASMFT